MTDATAAGTFAHRVRAAREALDLTQAELAHAAGVSLSAVAKWEQGDTEQPRKPQLERLAGALLTSPSFLLYGVDGEDTAITLPQLHHLVLRLAAVVEKRASAQTVIADHVSAAELRLGELDERLRVIEQQQGRAQRRRKAQ